MGCCIDEVADIYKRLNINIKKEHPRWTDN
jgi:hypothetical protein